MKRLAISSGIVLALAVAAPVAAQPPGGCPGAASGFVLVDIEAWWDRSVLGWAEEGIPVYAGGGYSEAFDAWAVTAGFADGAAVEAFVRGDQWNVIDRNGSGLACMKDLPNTPGSPGYIFVGVDDNAAS